MSMQVKKNPVVVNHRDHEEQWLLFQMAVDNLLYKKQLRFYIPVGGKQMQEDTNALMSITHLHWPNLVADNEILTYLWE